LWLDQGGRPLDHWYNFKNAQRVLRLCQSAQRSSADFPSMTAILNLSRPKSILPGEICVVYPIAIIHAVSCLLQIVESDSSPPFIEADF
jgi:hypothetical protein